MKRNILALMVMLSLAAFGCAQLTKQENTQSNLPTAETLMSQCAAGKALSPPVRVGACDDWNLIQSGCLALVNQPLVPAQSLLACTANGYAISGAFTRQ